MVPWTGAILILVVSIFRRDRARRWEDFVTAIGYTVFVGIATQAHVLLAHLTPHTCDPVLLAADGRLGFHTLAVADAIVHSNRWLMVALILGYTLMPAVLGLAWAMEQDRTMRRAALLGGCLCFAGYAILPAVGPAYYDWTRGVALFAPRNAMPSMHLTWALLIAVNARGRGLRAALWAYAGLLAVATIALGEHYLVDLLAAIPFAIAVQWLARHLDGVQAAVSRLWKPALAATVSPGEGRC